MEESNGESREYSAISGRQELSLRDSIGTPNTPFYFAIERRAF